MTNDDRLRAIERRMDEQCTKLDRIEQALSAIAVQNSRIEDLQRDVSSLWLKWDSISCPGGTISKIEKWQASCPRTQIKFLWWFVTGVGIALAGIGLSLIRG